LPAPGAPREERKKAIERSRATEFKLRCERRLGEMLKGMKAEGKISEGQPKENCHGPRAVLANQRC